MEEQQPKQELKYFVRIANTDLDGNKSIYSALTKIKGVSFMFSNAICNITDIEKTKRRKPITSENYFPLMPVFKQ